MATTKRKLPSTTKVLTLKLARRTTATPLVWPDDLGRVKTRILLTLDGVTTVLCEGSCSGGIRLGSGGEIAEYQLQASQSRMVDGALRNVIDLAKVAEVQYEVELVKGAVVTTLSAEET